MPGDKTNRSSNWKLHQTVSYKYFAFFLFCSFLFVWSLGSRSTFAGKSPVIHTSYMWKLCRKPLNKVAGPCSRAHRRQLRSTWNPRPFCSQTQSTDCWTTTFLPHVLSYFEWKLDQICTVTSSFSPLWCVLMSSDITAQSFKFSFQHLLLLHACWSEIAQAKNI